MGSRDLPTTLLGAGRVDPGSYQQALSGPRLDDVCYVSGTALSTLQIN